MEKNTGDISFYTTKDMLQMKADAFNAGKMWLFEKICEGLSMICWGTIIVLLLVHYFK